MIGRTSCLLLAAVSLMPVAQDAQRPANGDDAAAILAELHARTFASPFYAVAVVTTQRGDLQRELWLRLHYRGPGHLLTQIDRSTRSEAKVALLQEGRMHLYFPKADLVVDVPTGGGWRVFGTDFTVEDLFVLGADPSRYDAVVEGTERLDGVPCQRLLLLPRSAADSFDEEIRLWVSEDGHVPMRIEATAQGGRARRTLTLEGRPGLLPHLWTVRSSGLREGKTVLDFRFFEIEPHIDPELFTVEQIKAWR